MLFAPSNRRPGHLVARPLARGLALVLIALFVATLPRAVSADHGFVARAASVTVAAGDTANVNLEIHNVPAPGLGAWTITVRYDPAALTIVECRPDPQTKLPNSLCNPRYRDNMVAAGGFEVSPNKTGDFVLAELRFRLSGSARACASLEVTVVQLANSRAETLQPGAENGQVCPRGAATATATPRASATPSPQASPTLTPAGAATATPVAASPAPDASASPQAASPEGNPTAVSAESVPPDASAALPAASRLPASAAAPIVAPNVGDGGLESP